MYMMLNHWLYVYVHNLYKLVSLDLATTCTLSLCRCSLLVHIGQKKTIPKIEARMSTFDNITLPDIRQNECGLH